ncbi:MAG: SMC-Scp complex subunit ScpB [Fimbriimonadaceae bacterium]
MIASTQNSTCLALQAVLFVADRPLTAKELAEYMDCATEDVSEAVRELESLLEDRSGLRLLKVAGGYQLATKPEYAQSVSRYLKPARTRLSKTLMEVLSVVAYRQPVTSAQIEEIRGVQSDYGLRELTDRGLIQEVGRATTPGRPILYGTTKQFLHSFLLDSLDELPQLPNQEQPALIADGGDSI